MQWFTPSSIVNVAGADVGTDFVACVDWSHSKKNLFCLDVDVDAEVDPMSKT
jgi:hypothetical protein